MFRVPADEKLSAGCSELSKDDGLRIQVYFIILLDASKLEFCITIRVVKGVNGKRASYSTSSLLRGFSTRL
jgi:hypothetical protein